MPEPEALVRALIVDLGTTLLDAMAVGAGALVRSILSLRGGSRLSLCKLAEVSGLERHVAARLALAPGEYRLLGDDVAAVVAAPAAQLIRVTTFDGARFFAEHRGRPEAAARALLAKHGEFAGLPLEPELRALVLDLVTAWFSANAEHPIDVHALESAFRAEVLDELERLESAGKALDETAREVRELLRGRSILPVPYYPRPRLGEFAPSALLDPRYAIVPFEGRSTTIAELLEWCDDPEGQTLSVALVHGVGGRGKTRLILETAKALQRRDNEDERWSCAGLLELDATSLVPEQLESLFRSNSRAFIGIDRAERNVEAVVQVLRAASSCRHGRRLRVVLGARSDGDWWAALRTLDEGGIRQVLAAPGTREIPLAPLAPKTSDRETLYRSARTAFAAALGCDPVAWTIAPAPSLDASYLDDSLLLHMTALSNVLEFSPESESELFDSMLDAERHYWRRRHPDSAIDEAVVGVIGRTLAIVTLAQGAHSRKYVRYTVAAVLELDARTDAIGDQVTDRLFRLYGQADGSLAPLQPDRLGEFLVLRALQREPRLLDIVLDRHGLVGEVALVRPAALTVLTRLAKWRIEEGKGLLKQALDGRFDELISHVLVVGRETGDPIGKVAAEVLDALEDRQEAALLFVGDLPKESVALLELSELVTRLVASDRPLDGASAADHHAHAIRLLNLTNRWFDLGRIDDALVEGIAVVLLLERNVERMELECVSTDVYDYMTIGRARAYSALSIRLAAVGVAVDAMTESARHAFSERLPPGRLAGEEIKGLERSALMRCALAVALHARVLAVPIVERRSGDFAIDMDHILFTLSNRYDDLGHLREAYNAIVECERIYEWMRIGEGEQAIRARAAQRALDPYERDSRYTTVLMNLSNRQGSLYKTRVDLSEPERRLLADQAFATINRALAIDRALVNIYPDAHRPKLVTTLINRTVRLSDLEMHEDAVADATEAIEILLELRVVRPALFTGDLIAAYTNRLFALRALEGCDEAVDGDERAREELRKGRPDEGICV